VSEYRTHLLNSDPQAIAVTKEFGHLTRRSISMLDSAEFYAAIMQPSVLNPSEYLGVCIG